MKYNPLQNETLNITETFSKSTNDSKASTNNGSSNTSGSSSSASSSNSSSLQINSDTPQGQITKANILAGNYATTTSGNEGTTQVADTTNTSSTNQVANTENVSLTGQEASTRNKTGFDLKMTKADLIANYRKNIINIYEEIVNEMNSLFFALF